MWEEYDEEYIYICPKCGNVNLFGFRDKDCVSCEFPMKDNIKTNYRFGWYFSLSKEQQKDWEKKMRERYVLCSDNPYYDKDAYYEREDEDYEADLDFERAFPKSDKMQQDQHQSTQTVCPKCGSTSFTPVRRKWSFLTGFMTNKVDMVCNNCGCTVKKG